MVKIPATGTEKKIEVTLDPAFRTNENDVKRRCFEFLNQAEIGFQLKDRLYSLVNSGRPLQAILTELYSSADDNNLCGALAEILTAYSEK